MLTRKPAERERLYARANEGTEVSAWLVKEAQEIQRSEARRQSRAKRERRYARLNERSEVKAAPT